MLSKVRKVLKGELNFISIFVFKTAECEVMIKPLLKILKLKILSNKNIRFNQSNSNNAFVEKGQLTYITHVLFKQLLLNDTS